MTTAFRHPYLLAVLALLLLLAIAIAFLVLPSLVGHAPVVQHLLGAYLTPDFQYHHG